MFDDDPAHPVKRWGPEATPNRRMDSKYQSLFVMNPMPGAELELMTKWNNRIFITYEGLENMRLAVGYSGQWFKCDIEVCICLIGQGSPCKGILN